MLITSIIRKNKARDNHALGIINKVVGKDSIRAAMRPPERDHVVAILRDSLRNG